MEKSNVGFAMKRRGQIAACGGQDPSRLPFTLRASIGQGQIGLIDIATDGVTLFKKETSSENWQQPVWSPDGAHILFTIRPTAEQHLAMINNRIASDRFRRA
jgi:Tol biopolymer transport system component